MLKRGWQRTRSRLLAVRRHSWLLGCVACLSGWIIFLAFVGSDFHSPWLLLIDAPLNAGWIFCAFAASGLLAEAFRRPSYVVSDKRPSAWRLLAELTSALFGLAVIGGLGVATGYGLVHALGGLGWALVAVFLAVVVVRGYFGVRADLRARRAAREAFKAENAI